MEDFLDEEKGSHSSFNFKQYLFKLSVYYKWIILSLIAAIIGGFLYLKYEVSQYEVDGYILVGGGDLEGGTNAILNNAGILSSSDGQVSTVNNEIFILKSFKIMGDVVDSLGLDINISENGRFKNQPVYKDSLPVKIVVKKPAKYVNVASPLYDLTINDDGFKLKHNDKIYNGKYGQAFITANDTVIITKKSSQAHIYNKEYTLKIQGRLQTIKKYRGRITVAQAKNAGIGLLQISIIDELPARGFKIIGVLIDAYNASYLNYKNLAIRRALRFLDQRLVSVSADLEKQENQVRDFKANNKIYDVPSVATDMLTRIESGDIQKEQNAYQSELLDLVEKSVKHYNNKEEIVANANGLTDQVLTGEVGAYNALVQQKQTILSIGTANDVRLPGINDQLEKQRENILKNITNIRKQFSVYNTYLSKQNNIFSNKFQTLPEKDKLYIELNRKLSVQEALYTFILQKKEETGLQLVSEGTVRSRTVDDILSQGLVSPKKSVVYSVAVVVGILMPCLIIFLIVFLNKKIETKSEIEEGTNAPILGELSMAPFSTEPIVITSTNRTAIAEQFRAIRTNLSYIGAGTGKQNVIIVTSSVSGEGKSFVSLNLANSMAIIDKKVIVLELDLRKPALSNKFSIKSSSGISGYLANEKVKPEDIILPIAGYPNLSLISSGPIPPNPGELITSPRMAELINDLRQKFDYVILDTPPVGIVADSISLGQLADAAVFVVRQKYSFRSALDLINDLKENNKLPHMSLIINGIEDDNSYGYGYGYGGYGYGYYSTDADKDSKSIFNGLKSIFRKKK